MSINMTTVLADGEGKSKGDEERAEERTWRVNSPTLPPTSLTIALADGEEKSKGEEEMVWHVNSPTLTPTSPWQASSIRLPPLVAVGGGRSTKKLNRKISRRMSPRNNDAEILKGEVR